MRATSGNACFSTLHLASYYYNTPPHVVLQDFYAKKVKITTKKEWPRTTRVQGRVYRLSVEAVRLEEFRAADAVEHDLVESGIGIPTVDDEEVAHVEDGRLGLAELVRHHPGVHTGPEAGVIEFLGHLDADAAFRRRSDQQHVLIDVAEHVREHHLLVVIADGAEHLGQVDHSRSGVRADEAHLSFLEEIRHLGLLPGIRIGPSAGHEDFAVDHAQNHLEGGLVVIAAGGLLLGLDLHGQNLPEEAHIGPLGKNDIVELELGAVPEVLVHHPPDREVGVFLVEFHGPTPIKNLEPFHRLVLTALISNQNEPMKDETFYNRF